MSKVNPIDPTDEALLKWEPNELWKELQLSDSQKADLRARVQVKIDRARADGVYERFASLRGKVEFSLDHRKLRGFE